MFSERRNMGERVNLENFLRVKSSVLSLSEMPGSTRDLQGRAQEKDLDPPEIQKDGE